MAYVEILPLLVVVNAAIVAALLAAIFYRRRQRRQRQALGLLWLRSLRVLLWEVQHHRGLSTGLLNGGTELLSQVHEIQLRVNNSINSIAALNNWMRDSDRWQGITRHWTRLATQFDHNDVDNNLLQHNKLIQNILYLIDDMAQEHDLLQCTSREGKPLHFAWRELLSAAESVGQARALGTGVVARKHCDTVARIRLNYLCHKIERHTNIAWRELSPTAEQKETLRTLLSYINRELLNTSLAVSVSEFFSVATAAVDSLYQQYDALLDQVG